MIAELIDKLDGAEIARDKIAAILAAEQASQQALATAAGEDPALWALRVYTERTSPWENFPTRDGAATPVVNVWWDSSDFEAAASNAVDRQKVAVTINVDCFGWGEAAADGTGHTAGDETAARDVQRAVRLVRNILMAGEYTYLDLRGLVWRRWVGSLTILRPQQDDPNAGRIVGARLAFRVELNETSPQVKEEILETLAVEVTRASDGQLIIATEYDYPTLET